MIKGTLLGALVLAALTACTPPPPDRVIPLGDGVVYRWTQSWGAEIIIDGEITHDTDEAFARAMEVQPKADMVILNSLGGYTAPARDIGQMLYRNGMDTLVNHQCASACTLIYAAANTRYARPNAQFGFHQSTQAGPMADIWTTDYYLSVGWAVEDAALLVAVGNFVPNYDMDWHDAQFAHSWGFVSEIIH